MSYFSITHNHVWKCIPLKTPLKNRLPTCENKKETLLHLPYNNKKYVTFNSFLIFFFNLWKEL